MQSAMETSKNDDEAAAADGHDELQGLSLGTENDSSDAAPPMPPTYLEAFHDAEGCDKTGSNNYERNLFESNDSPMPLKSADALFEKKRATSKKSATAFQGVELHLDNDAALMPPLDLEHLTGSPSTNIDKEKKSTVVTTENEASQFQLNSCHETNENGGDGHSPTGRIVCPCL